MDKTHPTTTDSKPVIKPIPQPASTPEAKKSTPSTSNPFATGPKTRRISQVLLESIPT